METESAELQIYNVITRNKYEILANIERNESFAEVQCPDTACNLTPLLEIAWNKFCFDTDIC